jgi:putative two-component system response regulator
MRMLNLQLQNQNEILEERVRERTRELEASRFEVLERLALAAEFRDDMTHEHTLRVGRSAALIAQEMNRSPAEVELIFRAAPLHDIGKIGIPDRILLKPERLTEEEFQVMQTHTTIGARILSEGATALMQTAEQLALTHHERWDGHGYPQQLRGTAIPLVSRIVSVADVFDALVHARPYKTAWPADQAMGELRYQSGHAFDPAVVEAFIAVLERESRGAPLRRET